MPSSTTPPAGDAAEQAARVAAARRALEELTPGMTIGLGSGRAVWAVIDAMRERWGTGSIPFRAAVASELTLARARDAGIELVHLDGSATLEVLLDGADEVAPGPDLLKGGGGALLREKLVVLAAQRFVCVAETPKRVERLGTSRRVPVEVVRFAWEATTRRVAAVVDDPQRRHAGDQPFVTDEGHYVLDCRLPAGAEAEEVAAELKAITGVVEHGLFLGMADRALLGRPDGGVDVMDAENAEEAPRSASPDK